MKFILFRDAFKNYSTEIPYKAMSSKCDLKKKLDPNKRVGIRGRPFWKWLTFQKSKNSANPPYFSLNSSPEGEKSVEEPEEDAVEEMDYFAADGDEDADLYSEDDCNLDVQQEMEVNESNAESQDVILTPCPCICIRISVFVFVCANLYLCICVFVYLYLYLCICICMCEFVVVYLYFCVLFVHTWLF